MSMFELLVIFMVAFFVMKPEDLPLIIEKIRDFYNFLTRAKMEISSYFDLDQKDDIVTDNNLEQINFYLEKIANLGGKYDGKYSVNKIRDHYQKLVKESIKAEGQQNLNKTKMS